MPRWLVAWADQAGAREYGEQALGIARELGAQESEGSGLRTLGHVYQDLGDPDTARGCYEQALRLFREMGLRSRAMGSLAGLAWAALTENDVTQAQAYVAEILAYLEAGGNLDNDSEALLDLPDLLPGAPGWRRSPRSRDPGHGSSTAA